MSDQDKRYNGWTNYETWNVALWMENDPGSDEYYRDQAQEAYLTAEPERSFTRAERATLDLADTLKEEFEENEPEIQNGPYADLLSAAMGEINWYEIAEHYIADLDTTEIDAEAAEVSE